MPESDDPPPPIPPESHGLPETSPDIIEETEGDQIDNSIPARAYGTMRVAGLGGSAGSLPALQSFFEAMPTDSGMAFVVIVHLSPEHESILAELLQRTTAMPVLQVTDRVKMETNRVYVIPPGKQLWIDDGHLVLSDMEPRTGRHVAVDLFFRTLADTHGPHAAAIVLSGADGDGAIGIKRIKERGGLGIAQVPEEAGHDGMPRSAIATGLVDWVLPVAEMPGKLLEYWRAEHRLRLPPEEGPPSTGESAARLMRGKTNPEGEQALHDILTYLRVRAGHDFSYYKRATILRRIGRRMQVNGIEDTPAYLAFLRTHPGEPMALLHDLLISVTNFFRDREAFAALQAAIPSLFAGKRPEDTVRVWVAACATGEEAYSVAMLLREHADTLAQPPRLQVFATDLDENALQAAREGIYTDTIAADVSPERLRRFFSKEHGHYKIKRETRELVLFALHDLLKDSPFSRLDLITCRNLLIYLNREAQARVLDIFHLALQPGGVLFLGTSESADGADALFATTSKKSRLYTRRATVRQSLPSFPDAGVLVRTILGRPAAKTAAPAPEAGEAKAAPVASTFQGSEGAGSWAQRHYQFIEHLAPPSVIVSADYKLVHLSANAGRFLQVVGGGHPTVDLLQMAHPMLRMELRAVLYRAAQTGVPTEARNVPVELEGKSTSVRLRIVPSMPAPSDCFLVVFEEEEFAAAPAVSPERIEREPELVVQHLEQEVERLRTHLRVTVEEAEASKEEHKATNEELQAINEELRSASEELETGREELQSINEELSTVNQELKSTVENLARSNSDLQNLMASTQIATLFLDRKLCIQRYTPPAVALFNLIPSDVERPLSDLSTRLDYPGLAQDAAQVLDQLCAIELEVAHEDGRHFLARMLPYRTADDRIAGVVLTFVDITYRRLTQEKVEAGEARFRAVVDLVPDLLWSTDAAGAMTWINRRWSDYTGQTLETLSGRDGFDAVPAGERAGAQGRFQQALARGEAYRDEFHLRRVDGELRWHLVRAEPLREADGRISQWFGAATDIDDFKRAVANLSASQEWVRLIVENAREYAIFTTDLEGLVTSWNQGAARILGYAEEKALGQHCRMIFTPEDQAAGVPSKELATALATGRAADERWHQRKDGSRFWANGALMAMQDAQGRAIGFVKILRDETEARETRRILEQSREDLAAAAAEADRARAATETAMQAKDHLLAVLSHELRTPLTPVLMAVSVLSQTPALPGPVREALTMIERNVKIESHFIDDLLDLTRITRGKLEIIREPMDLHDAVRHAVEISTADLEGKGQRLTVTFDAAEHRLTGDATRLQQVFWNLLKNASKFTPEGGAVRVASRNEPGRIVVEVSDTGIGFEPGTEARIFEAFTQASREVTQKFGGLGLGLAISKATVDAHGGTLHARSEGKGQGATFTVELPL